MNNKTFLDLLSIIKANMGEEMGYIPPPAPLAKKCRYCGTALIDLDGKCKNCGAPVTDQYTIRPKMPTVRPVGEVVL